MVVKKNILKEKKVAWNPIFHYMLLLTHDNALQAPHVIRSTIHVVSSCRSSQCHCHIAL